MHFFGSERGLLATPTQCGTYPVETDVHAHGTSSSRVQNSTQFFTVDSGPERRPCPGTPRPFEPEPQGRRGRQHGAARTRPFALGCTRNDGEQNLSRRRRHHAARASRPRLKGIPYCPQAAIDQLSDAGYSGLAELASSVLPRGQPGRHASIAGAGAGTQAAPHLRQGLSRRARTRARRSACVVVVPAVSGPYDLGNVVVRAALHVDPITAQVTAVSDPLPQILEGSRCGCARS